ncbi:hypothetical protein [Ramlibacter sp. AN1133]|uniref:hypothetical protein n=1 Tax=Ramlibacter sp. AN1133 TaxID=3133429 RepID=UPI0030C1F414
MDNRHLALLLAAVVGSGALAGCGGGGGNPGQCNGSPAVCGEGDAPATTSGTSTTTTTTTGTTTNTGTTTTTGSTAASAPAETNFTAGTGY